MSLIMLGGRRIAVEMSSVVGKSALHHVKGFFTDGKNPLKKFCSATSGVDKGLKTVIAATKLGTLLSSRVGDITSEAAFRNANSTFSTARGVIGLINVFQGAIPGCVHSSRTCGSIVRSLLHRQTEFDTRPENRRAGGDPLYTSILIGRREMIAGAISQACKTVGAGTFIINFGALRPRMFIGGITNSMSSEEASRCTTVSAYLMAANHIAGITDAGLSLWLESRAYGRAVLGSIPADGGRSQGDVISALRMSHVNRISLEVSKLLEKLIEFFCDLVKLIPAASVVPAEVTAAAGIVVGFLGMYKVWKTVA